MKITIKHLLEVILGEEDLQFFLNKEIKMGTSIFSESGYRVDINITVIKVNFISQNSFYIAHHFSALQSIKNLHIYSINNNTQSKQR